MAKTHAWGRGMKQEPDPDDAPRAAANSPGGETRPGAWWTWRAVLLGPAIIQLLVAYSLYRELRAGLAGPVILVPLALLHVAGGVGILGGVFGRSRGIFLLGLASTMLGVVFPIVMNAVAVPIDNDASSIPWLGVFDTESLGTLMFLRLLFEAPFWLLYVAIATVGYIRARAVWRRSPHQTLS
jgi:hypothetical protein